MRVRTTGGIVGMLTLAACGADRTVLLDATIEVTPLDASHDAARPIEASAPDISPPEASAPDVAVLDADAAPDAPAIDAAPDVPDAAADARDVIDAADVVDAFVDAGPTARCTPTVDGTIGADWTADAIVATNSATSIWSGNSLGVLRVCYDATNLYLGVTGTVQSNNAIVVYLDRDYGSASGIADFSALTDESGTLDQAVSAAFVLGDPVAGFEAEGAWGTVGMASVAANASLTEPRVGLRMFLPITGHDRRSDFGWIANVATTCNATSGACETAIPWAALFESASPPASGTVAMFARVVNGDGTMSPNLTLPVDDNGAHARTVDRVLVVPFTR